MKTEFSIVERKYKMKPERDRMDRARSKGRKTPYSYSCPRCSFKSPASNKLSFHMEEHKNKELTACDKCDWVSCNERALPFHKRAAHTGQGAVDQKYGQQQQELLGPRRVEKLIIKRINIPKKSASPTPSSSSSEVSYVLISSSSEDEETGDEMDEEDQLPDPTWPSNGSDSGGGALSISSRKISWMEEENPYKCGYCTHRGMDLNEMFDHLKSCSYARARDAVSRDEDEVVEPELKFEIKQPDTPKKKHSNTPKKEPATPKKKHSNTPKKEPATPKKKPKSGHKLFQCSFCVYYSTNARGNLIEHERTHTGEKPFPCTVLGCTYRCARERSLRAHLLTNHVVKAKVGPKKKIQHRSTPSVQDQSPRPFPCSYCPHRSLTRQHWHRHEKVHTG